MLWPYRSSVLQFCLTFQFKCSGPRWLMRFTLRTLVVANLGLSQHSIYYLHDISLHSSRLFARKYRWPNPRRGCSHCDFLCLNSGSHPGHRCGWLGVNYVIPGKRGLCFYPIQWAKQPATFWAMFCFLALESADFCNKYLRFEPQPRGIVTLSGSVFIAVRSLYVCKSFRQYVTLG